MTLLIGGPRVDMAQFDNACVRTRKSWSKTSAIEARNLPPHLPCTRRLINT